tara:strand:+ start:76 stop:564 length:489 start_codon:yes stop_codon:yes gene_type:complete
MGILDKIFGAGSSDDDKWVLYVSMSMALAQADGETTQEEVEGSIVRLLRDKGVSQDKIPSIVEKAQNQDLGETFTKIRDFKDDDKLDLISYLINISHDDGYFHGEELVFICLAGSMMGLDGEYLYNHLTTHENYLKVDQDEINKAFERVNNSFQKLKQQHNL